MHVAIDLHSAHGCKDELHTRASRIADEGYFAFTSFGTQPANVKFKAVLCTPSSKEARACRHFRDTLVLLSRLTQASMTSLPQPVSFEKYNVFPESGL